ncbi:MAG: RNA polymerase sigma factor [Bacteroidota bacterium]
MVASFNDPEYFEYIFRKYHVQLYNIVYKYTNSEHQAEDVIQEVFVKLWEKGEKIKINSSVKSYLFRSAINMAITKARVNKHVKNYEDIAGNDNIEGLFIDEGKKQDEDEMKKMVQEEIQNLPPACRSVFIMNRFEDMSYKEIAEVLGVSVKTVDNHLWKAMKFLKKSLAKYECFVLVFLLFIFI